MEGALDVYQDKGDKNISFQKKYVQSIAGLIKLIEIMLLLFSFAMAFSFKNGVSVFLNYGTGTIDFHLAIAILGWLGAIAFFLGYAFNLVVVAKEKVQPLMIVLTIVHGVGAAFVFVSTIVLLNDCVKARKSIVGRLNLCDYISATTSTSCSVIEASGAFGFFAFIAIFADAALHMLQFVKERKAAQESQSGGASFEGKTNEGVDTETEIPNP